MAEISSSAATAAALSLPPEPPAEEGQGGGSDHDTFSPLVDLLERFPDLFAQKVLAHLDPIDRTFLAQTGSACRAGVVASELPRAGWRVEALGKMVWVVWHSLEDFVSSVERLAWAKASGCPWAERTTYLVSKGGHLEVLRWARENACPWDTRVSTWAAMGGHLAVLKWAREHGCPWEEAWICAYAAHGGHLEMLKWAREHYCPWDEGTCTFAAQNGHLEVLRWAREHGCPWVKRQCAAASYNHTQTLAWVWAQP
jgi:hypothetical protein